MEQNGVKKCSVQKDFVIKIVYTVKLNSPLSSSFSK